MPKQMDIAEINRRLSLYEQRLREMEWEADQLPLRSVRVKPDDECPRGHKYPENPKTAPTGKRKQVCRQCETCRHARSQRMHLRERIKKMKEMRKEYTW